MAISMTTTMLFLIIVPLLVTLLFPSTCVADENNLLLTGDVLGTDDELSNHAATFVMQNDCNLVLYAKGKGFVSNTRNRGTSCTLTLNDRGQLVIKSSNGSTVWTSTPSVKTKAGNYAAVLSPWGDVSIYGPSLFATPDFGFSAAGSEATEMTNIPMERNVLFSSQTLYNSSKLMTRDYTFIMQDDCNLVLIKSSLGDIWNSGTQGKGTNCFARLDHRGQLAVVSDKYKVLFGSEPTSKQGDYVLILQINGQAVVYGPVVWSTSSS